MRDKLIELLRQVNFDFSEECVACSEDGYKTMPSLEEFFADYLLSNNVIILPCKIGDTVYVIGGKYRHGSVEKWINTGKFRFSDIDKLGKTVFLSKEEAEKALGGAQE